MSNILWFKEVSINDVSLAGGKGASLGEMIQKDFPIPNGFIVTSKAYFDFIENTNIKQEIINTIDSIDVENTIILEKESKRVRELILSKPFPSSLKTSLLDFYQQLNIEENNGASCFVAVRSSATAEDLPEASFAGQQETFLNVMGFEELVHSVKKCWASLFTSRAVYYRKKQGFLTEQVGLCVVVQKMVQSDVSGIMFTVDPMGNKNNLVIEAGLGLGETIVSGSITPDNYVVDKNSFKILLKKINKQEFLLTKKDGINVEETLPESKASSQKFSDEKIVELARIGARIEAHYKTPMDIEWAQENNKLFIVQARPITTLNIKPQTNTNNTITQSQDIEKNFANQQVLLTGLPASPGIVSGIAKIVPSIDDITKINSGEILVTKMTSPSWVPIMKKTIGIITNEGGVTCHAAIVSRELGIPCVVGTSNATETITNGSEITIDGYSGKVFLGKISIAYEKKKIKVLEEHEIDNLEKGLKIKTKKELPHHIKQDINLLHKEFGNKPFTKMLPEEQEQELLILKNILKEISVQVKVNVALPDAAEQASKTKAIGVGLLRAEHMITSSGMHPAEFVRQGKETELKNIVKQGIKIVAEKFSGPVWFRTFDARSDEFRELIGGEKELNEDNPMLGWHGIRRDIDRPEMFKAQILAIKELRQSGIRNVGVMLPFVQSVDEVVLAKKIALETGLQEDVDFGVMVETPASVWIIDELIPHIDFISFGTNDLTQLTLGMDRNNERVQKNFTELHPAILRQIEFVIKKCKKAGVLTSICGQAASDPEMVKKLVWFGIDSVSANIDAVDDIKKIVMIEEKKRLLELLTNNDSTSFFKKLFKK